MSYYCFVIQTQGDGKAQNTLAYYLRQIYFLNRKKLTALAAFQRDTDFKTKRKLREIEHCQAQITQKQAFIRRWPQDTNAQIKLMSLNNKLTQLLKEGNAQQIVRARQYVRLEAEHDIKIQHYHILIQGLAAKIDNEVAERCYEDQDAEEYLEFHNRLHFERYGVYPSALPPPEAVEAIEGE